MRPRVEWMNQTDDRLLDLLDESDLELSPAVLAKNLDYSRSWVSRRLSKLVDAELVAVDDGSYYSITQRGRDYLAGDLEAEDLQLSDE
ncbi:helix-turn-helix domain-containing protein [Haloarcula amylolytica]|uniref:helix-turn-helix domain-containing protein n=1 Tax=Haloarcula amylolytica TaxID=396317 RepID=UPI003C76B525